MARRPRRRAGSGVVAKPSLLFRRRSVRAESARPSSSSGMAGGRRAIFRASMAFIVNHGLSRNRCLIIFNLIFEIEAKSMSSIFKSGVQSWHVVPRARRRGGLKSVRGRGRMCRCNILMPTFQARAFCGREGNSPLARCDSALAAGR